MKERRGGPAASGASLATAPGSALARLAGREGRTAMGTTGNTDIEFDVRVSETALAGGERERVLAAPGFGEVFTDHMITIRWTEADGWHDARLEPYGPFTLDPATSVFHYAQEIFEGLKAYRTGGGEIVAFRPQAN